MITPMERLRRWLEESGTTQTALARSIGVSQPAVSDWINGRTSPTLEKLRSLREVTGLTSDELLGDSLPVVRGADRLSA